MGKTYEEKEARVCETGFYACENPLNVLQYYPPCYGNRYCEVEQDGEFSDNRDDSKIASTKMRDPKRIDEFCELLKRFWKEVPDWRFGQLISNLGRQFEWTPGGFFYMEDEEFMDTLEGILAKLNRYE